MWLATLCGWGATSILGGSAFYWHFSDSGEHFGLTDYVQVVAYNVGFGCLIAFPVCALWFAILARAHWPIARLAVAPWFGAACGAALGLLLTLAWSGGVLLRASVLMMLCGLGAVTGAAICTSYVLLARWRGARELAELQRDGSAPKSVA